MSEPEALPAHIHHETALLPWYVNGSLGESERQQVDQHLAACVDCRRELDELARLRSELTALYRAEPGASSRTARRVLEDVARDAAARRMSTGRKSSLEHVDQWFRSLFLPRWVPTLAAVLLLAQTGLLLWISAPAPEQIMSRSVGRAARIAVTFHGTATEEQIRSLLRTVHGRLVGGPTTDGQYILEITAGTEAAGEDTLKVLRGRTDIVRSAGLQIP